MSNVTKLQNHLPQHHKYTQNPSGYRLSGQRQLKQVRTIFQDFIENDYQQNFPASVHGFESSGFFQG